MKKNTWKTLALAFTLASVETNAAIEAEGNPVAIQDNIGKYVTQRPKLEERLFRSDAVEKKIKEIKAMLKNPYLAWMFENCFPNTLDTTVHFRHTDGKPDTFVYTGDIHAMWLRDSGAQVWPYVQLANDDPKLKEMLEGVIRRQFICIIFLIVNII